jgi:hypothetical protein
VAHVSNSGAILSGPTGFTGAVGTYGLAVDGSGNVWNLGFSVYELVGAATPVVTPIAAGVTAKTIGARP